MPFRKITVAAEKAISGKDKVGGKKKKSKTLSSVGTEQSIVEQQQYDSEPCHATSLRLVNYCKTKVFLLKQIVLPSNLHFSS